MNAEVFDARPLKGYLTPEIFGIAEAMA